MLSNIELMGVLAFLKAGTAETCEHLAADVKASQ
jgi:hypothetical protein